MKEFKKEIRVFDFEGMENLDGFCVEVLKEIESSEELYNFWIYHKEYNIKDFIVGIPAKYIKDEWELRDIIANNIEESIEYYKEQYAQELLEDEDEINLNIIADEIIERYIEDKQEYDIERDEAFEMLQKAVLEDNIDLNNDTTSYDLEDLLEDEEQYEELQRIIKYKVANYEER